MAGWLRPLRYSCRQWARATARLLPTASSSEDGPGRSAGTRTPRGTVSPFRCAVKALLTVTGETAADPFLNSRPRFLRLP